MSTFYPYTHIFILSTHSLDLNLKYTYFMQEIPAHVSHTNSLLFVSSMSCTHIHASSTQHTTLTTHIQHSIIQHTHISAAHSHTHTHTHTLSLSLSLSLSFTSKHIYSSLFWTKTDLNLVIKHSQLLRQLQIFRKIPDQVQIFSKPPRTRLSTLISIHKLMRKITQGKILPIKAWRYAKKVTYA
jgi:hypothetical protein